jgi:hypothetical protein
LFALQAGVSSLGATCLTLLWAYQHIVEVPKKGGGSEYRPRGDTVYLHSLLNKLNAARATSLSTVQPAHAAARHAPRICGSCTA